MYTCAREILLVCFKWNERRSVPLPISPTLSLHILDPQEKEAGSAERDLPKLLSAPLCIVYKDPAPKHPAENLKLSPEHVPCMFHELM